MNKLLLICLLGAALVALSGAELSNGEQSVSDLSQVREVRAADPGKGKGQGKGKGLRKKDKKKRKNLKKSDKKGAGKRNGDRKKGKKNGAKRSKNDGKGKKRKNGAKKNGKKQKGLKKKSRKDKSEGKGKGKNKETKKKKARKAAKKQDKKDEKKKAKKEKKKARKAKKKARKQKKKFKKERKNRKKAKGTARDSASFKSSCMNATCIDNAVTYMKQLKLAVKNFDKQYNRITTYDKQTTSKAGKNDEFAPYLIKLSETGGGNVSNLSCNGEYNQGATNLQTLYDNIASCESKVNESCNTNMPGVNMTFLDACKATMDLFVNKTKDAIDLNAKGSGAAACLIWESAEVANASAMISGCSIKSTEKAFTAATKACQNDFSWCRKEEDKVSKLVAACSSVNTAAKATAAIAQGTKNAAAATAVSAKVNATLAATRSATPRSTNLSCGDFATEVTAISTQVSGAPLVANLETMLTALTSYVVEVCTDTEKSSLGNASTTFLESTESITVAIAEKQSALNISTGTTVSSAEIAAIANATTVAATTVTTTTGTTGTTTTGTTGTTTTGTTGTTTTGTTGTTTTGTTGTTTIGTTGTTTTGTTGTTTTGTTGTTTTGTTVTTTAGTTVTTTAGTTVTTTAGTTATTTAGTTVTTTTGTTVTTTAAATTTTAAATTTTAEATTAS